MHLALESNEPDICAIKAVFPQPENKFPFLANSFSLQKLQQLSKMPIQVALAFYPLAMFLQLSKGIISVYLKINTGKAKSILKFRWFKKPMEA